MVEESRLLLTLFPLKRELVRIPLEAEDGRHATLYLLIEFPPSDASVLHYCLPKMAIRS
jgi:hypothetical protein